MALGVLSEDRGVEGKRQVRVFGWSLIKILRSVEVAQVKQLPFLIPSRSRILHCIIARVALWQGLRRRKEQSGPQPAITFYQLAHVSVTISSKTDEQT